MTRASVSLREAAVGDADLLAELWGVPTLRRLEPDGQVSDLRAVIARIEPLRDERLLVAEYDGQLAGAVHLRATTLTPLNLEPVVQAISPHVLPQFRRHGVGQALMEAAVAFAEELGVGHVATGVAPGSRESNRFMARLGLGPQALLRVAPTPVVKARLAALRPVMGRAGGRQLTSVLAVRRSMRRSEPTGQR